MIENKIITGWDKQEREGLDIDSRLAQENKEGWKAVGIAIDGLRTCVLLEREIHETTVFIEGTLPH